MAADRETERAASTVPCPACRGARTAEVESASVDEIARAWARQPRVEARFDDVAMFQIVEYLEDPDAVFRDIATISRPGTTLLAGCPADRRHTRRVPHPERIGRSDFRHWPPQRATREGA
jgi:hypothetical protein